MTASPSDPLERIVADALDKAAIAYVMGEGGGNPAGLDFHLPDVDVHIEVKRFHSERISEQMARAPNVIAVQGEAAVRWLAARIGGVIEVRDLPPPSRGD